MGMEKRTAGEFEEKLSRIRTYLEEKKLDAVYLKRRSNFSWITCGGDNRIVDHSEYGWSGVLVTKDRAVLVTDNTEMPRIVDEELGGLHLETYEYTWYKADLEDSIIKVCGSRNVACDVESSQLKQLDKDFDRIQYQLTKPEIDRFGELGRTTSQAFTQVGKDIERGMTELDVAAMISFELMRHNIQPQLILVACDNRISDYRHPIPTNKSIEQYVMYVAVAVKWGLNLSITRFVHFGEPSEDLRQRYEAIINIDARLILNTRPGRRLVDIFSEHQKNYARYGFPDEWRKLHQGGSASYRIRDVKVTLDTPASEIVMVNQVYAWNPSISGIKSEDTVAILADKNEILSEDPNWPLVEVSVEGEKISRPGLMIKE
jgi:Xaa-Pro dipeptidase